MKSAVKLGIALEVLDNVAIGKDGMDSQSAIHLKEYIAELQEKLEASQKAYHIESDERLKYQLQYDDARQKIARRNLQIADLKKKSDKYLYLLKEVDNIASEEAGQTRVATLIHKKLDSLYV